MKTFIKVLGTALFFFMVACDSPDFELKLPYGTQNATGGGKIFDSSDESLKTTMIAADGTYQFMVKLATEAAEDRLITLNTSALPSVVEKYNEFKGTKDYELLPEANYTFTEATLKEGETSTTLNVEIKDYDNLPQGYYVLPLNVTVGSEELLYMLSVWKDAEFVKLSDANPKPMPPGSYSCPDRTKPMKMVAYVETNDWDIRNMGQFILKDSKKPVFDIVVLFAANMNYDAKSGKRVLFFNTELQKIVKDPERYIKPLQDRGIKVIVDILPNHQGVGYSNFQSYDDALEFAKECKAAADKLGFDGFDIDEEYADYHNQPNLPTKGTQSFFWYMRAMKEVMPDKLLTLYDYGHSIDAFYVDEQGKSASDYLDYSWADYGASGDSRAGLPRERHGSRSCQAAYNIWSGSYNASSNIDDCYGLYMFFNIQGWNINNGNAADALSSVCQKYYGEECIFEGNYHKGPKGN